MALPCSVDFSENYSIIQSINYSYNVSIISKEVNYKLCLLSKSFLQNVHSIYYCCFFVWIRNSLIYNMMKMAILVLVTIFVLFKFTPHTAHIDFKSPEESGYLNILGADDSILYVTSGEVNLTISTWNNIHVDNDMRKYILGDQNIESNQITLKSFGPFIFNGNLLPEQTSIILFPIENSGILTFSIEKNENKDDPIANFVPYYSKETGIDPNFEMGYSLDNFCGINASFNHGLRVSLPTKTKVKLKGFIAKIFISGEEIIEEIEEKDFIIENCLIDIPYETSIFELTRDFSKYMYIVNGIHNLKYKGNGELFFSNSPNSLEYSLRNQELMIDGLNNTLTAKKLFNDSNITFSGITDEISLSGMSLFPSFSGWYRDNIYLAPLSLISIIFGSISLLRFKQKDK